MRVNTLILKMSIEQQMSTLKFEMQSLRDEVVSLKGIIMKQNYTIMNLMQDQRNVMAPLRTDNATNLKFLKAFPIDTQQQLEALETQLNAANRDAYVSTMRKLLAPEGLRRNLHKIISRRMVMELAMRSKQHKRSLQDYKRFMDALFRASYREGMTYRRFLDELRFSLRRIHRHSMQKMDNRHIQLHAAR